MPKATRNAVGRMRPGRSGARRTANEAEDGPTGPATSRERVPRERGRRTGTPSPGILEARREEGAPRVRVVVARGPNRIFQSARGTPASRTPRGFASRSGLTAEQRRRGTGWRHHGADHDARRPPRLSIRAGFRRRRPDGGEILSSAERRRAEGREGTSRRKRKGNASTGRSPDDGEGRGRAPDSFGSRRDERTASGKGVGIEAILLCGTERRPAGRPGRRSARSPSSSLNRAGKGTPDACGGYARGKGESKREVGAGPAVRLGDTVAPMAPVACGGRRP